ncbi:MAG: CPBP family intramembrane metalloprotease [Candidatus Omnitrophica bacterium]|nr:CPBP family intramembrane metalloprotease [Candidatus Omnitrophota bacterium]
MPLISKKSWITFCILSLLSIGAWQAFTAPQLSFIDLSISRPHAVLLASKYLIDEIGLTSQDLAKYSTATVFDSRNGSDQYLQKAIGFKKELEFLNDYNFELFYWTVRFFKENQKEEYFIKLSAATGEVTSYFHEIDENAYRPDQTEKQAREKAVAFLKKKFDFDPKLWIMHANISQKHERRTDFSFSWEHQHVKIPWSRKPETGWAILQTGATISGDEVVDFYKNNLKIPDQYHRYLASIKTVGNNLSVIFTILFYIILTASVFYVIIHRNSLVMHSVKRFAILLAVGAFLTYLISYGNNFEEVLFAYPTTISMKSYLWLNITTTITRTFISVLSILMPCLAGEALHHAMFPNRKEGAFLHYLQSTFFSRNVASAIGIGYLSAAIMIGIQSVAFEIGQRYLGVWTQYSWMTQTSGSYFPFLAAFIFGITAGLSEEIYFRLFGISIGKKFFRNTLLACLISSIIWGYGHSGYPVFPMWFRGLEVTCLGLFLSYIYLRFGILAVITTHYLFDVFWGSSAYLLGKAPATQFYGSLIVLSLPMLWAIIAFFINKEVIARQLCWKLNVHQLFNLKILKEYLKNTNLLNEKPADQLKHEIANHGWDLAVVEMAIDDLTKKKD